MMLHNGESSRISELTHSPRAHRRARSGFYNAPASVLPSTGGDSCSTRFFCEDGVQVSPRNGSHVIQQKQHRQSDHLRSETGRDDSPRQNSPPLSPPVSPRRNARNLDLGYIYPPPAIMREKTSVLRALLVGVALCAVVVPCMLWYGNGAGGREGGVRGGFAGYSYDSDDAATASAAAAGVPIEGREGGGSLRGVDITRRSALATEAKLGETDHSFLRGSVSGSKSSEVLAANGEWLGATERGPTQDQPVATSVRMRGSTKINDSPSTTQQQQLQQDGSAVRSNVGGSNTINDNRRSSSNSGAKNNSTTSSNSNSNNLREQGGKIATTAVGAAVKCDSRKIGHNSSMEAENNQEEDQQRNWLLAVHIDRSATTDSSNSMAQMGRHLRGYKWYQQQQQQQLLEQRGLLPHEYFARVVEAALGAIADIESGTSVDVLVVSEGMRLGEDGGVEVLVDEVGMPVEDWDVPAVLCKGLGLMCTQSLILLDESTSVPDVLERVAKADVLVSSEANNYFSKAAMALSSNVKVVTTDWAPDEDEEMVIVDPLSVLSGSKMSLVDMMEFERIIREYRDCTRPL